MASATKQRSPRVARKRQRARDRIVDAAKQVVQRDGYDSVTIDAVANEADVSKPSVYYYFSSKEAVIRALAIRRAHVEIEVLRTAIASATAVSVVRDVVRAYVNHHRDALNLFRAEYVLGQLVGPDPDAPDETVEAAMAEMFDAFAAKLETAAADAQLRDGVHPRRVAVGVWSASHGLVSTLSVLDHGGRRLPYDIDAMVDELGQMLSRGVFVDS